MKQQLFQKDFILGKLIDNYGWGVIYVTINIFLKHMKLLYLKDKLKTKENYSKQVSELPCFLRML